MLRVTDFDEHGSPISWLRWHAKETELAIPSEIVASFGPERAAFIQIDMQRRHVDPHVGYHLVDTRKSAAIVSASQKLLSAIRSANAPLLHVITYSRRPSPWGLVDAANPFWKYQNGKIVPGMERPRQMDKNIDGSAYAEIMPALAPQRNEPIIIKKRYSGFYQTDLEMMLRGLRAEMIFLWGVNTNNCVLATAYDAFSRDFCVAVIGDACGSMNGDDYHDAALKQIEAAIGFVTSVDEVTHFLTPARAA